jgi:hypothetical protein
VLCYASFCISRITVIHTDRLFVQGSGGWAPLYEDQVFACSSIISVASVCLKFVPYTELFYLFSINLYDVTSFAQRFTMGRHWNILSFWRYCNKCSISIRQSVIFCWTPGRTGLHDNEACDAAAKDAAWSEIMELTLP